MKKKTTKRKKKTIMMKKRIINALEEKRERIVHIEIKRSEYVPNRWNIRIGDIIGSTEMSNIEIKEILDFIKDKMLDLK